MTDPELVPDTPDDLAAAARIDALPRETFEESLIERLATNPAVDVAKLEKLIEMQERVQAVAARAAFNAAFAEMQGEIPTITERGEIRNKGTLQSTYARNEDIQRVVKPILQAHGFSLRFRHEPMDGGLLRVVGILAHRNGHAEEDSFITAADPSGAKNAIQALGSARAYGQRYTTVALLNIATAGEDDDGRGTAPPPPAPPEPPPAPAGFDQWRLDLTAVADNGLDALAATWASAPKAYRKHVAATEPTAMDKLKRKAAAVTPREA